MKNYVIFVRKLIYKIIGKIHSALHLNEAELLVLNYHCISEEDWMSVSLSEFKKQIKEVMKTHTPISVCDFYRFMCGHGISTPSFLVTFDDGYKSVTRVADFLEDLGIRPLIFVLSDDKNVNKSEINHPTSFLNISDIKTLVKRGWFVGSHSATHPKLTNITGEDLRKEIVQSKNDLEKKLGMQIDYFAYPKGAYNDECLELVKKAGYKLAFSMDDGLVTKLSNKYSIPRVGINKTQTLSEVVVATKPIAIPVRKIFKTVLV